MKKTLLTERQLIEKINDALAAGMPATGRDWNVASLRRVHKPTVNWEVDYRVGGEEPTIDQHRAEYRRVLEELEAKYDVDWSAQVDEA